MINKYKDVNAHVSMNGKRYVPVNWVINWNCLETTVTLNTAVKLEWGCPNGTKYPPRQPIQTPQVMRAKPFYLTARVYRRTDDPNTRCPRRTFKVGCIKNWEDAEVKVIRWPCYNEARLSKPWMQNMSHINSNTSIRSNAASCTSLKTQFKDL